MEIQALLWLVHIGTSKLQDEDVSENQETEKINIQMRPLWKYGENNFFIWLHFW